MKRIPIIIAAFLALSHFSCAKGPAREGLLIATSVFPVADIIQNIAGDTANVMHAVPPNANPHSFEPDIATVKKLQEAALFTGIHPEFDGWLERLMPGKTARAYLIGLMEDGNPHIWLSVRKARAIASLAKDRLTAINPAGAAAYQANLQSYEKKLDALEERIARLFRGLKGRPFVQWHPSWNYFAADYGLIVTGTIESGHGASPSMGQFKDLIERSRREGVKAVVVDLNVKSALAESLVREIGGRLVKLDSIGGPGIPGKATYIDLMETNAKTLADALAGE